MLFASLFSHEAQSFSVGWVSCRKIVAAVATYASPKLGDSQSPHNMGQSKSLKAAESIVQGGLIWQSGSPKPAED